MTFRLRTTLACLALVTLVVASAGPLFAQGSIRDGAEWDVVRIDPQIAQRVDFVFREWDRDGSPGASVGIVRDGELVFARGYGLADLEHRIPMTPRTVLHVASVSKQFTALAVALLASRGRLSLDDDIRDHVPEFPDLGHPITLRNLLHHTSGIRDQWSLLTLAGWRLDDVITREDILGLLTRQRELNFEPGTEYAYSNSGYMLLAEVVARTTGQSFREWTTEEVFEPLGMIDTHAHDDHQMIVPNRAESYARLPRGSYRRAPLNYATVGATSLFTTIEDMARWAATLMSGTFAPEVLDEMVRPTRLSNGVELAYGFGLSIGTADGHRVIQHGGADAGFRSHFALFPDADVAVIVLGNQAQMNAGQLAHRVATLFLPEASSDADPSPEPQRAPVAVDIDDGSLKPLLGLYWNPVLDAVREIRRSDGDLYYDRGAGNASELVYTGSSVFRMVGIDPPIEIRFERSSGAPAGSSRTDVMVVHPALEPEMRFWRIEPAPDSLAVGDYVGVFRSEEVGVGVRIVGSEEGIALVHPRHGTIDLRPVAKDRFDSDQWWLGSLRFTRDEQGRVVAFRSTSGRVRNLQFERADGQGEPGRFGR
jgi:CubicO group peptidase (beta-lactamase class C family)